MSQQDEQGRTGQHRAGAIRLTFEYEGADVRLVGQSPVDMIPPTTDALHGFEGQQGFWVEVRGSDGGVLHRQVLHHPVRMDAEVFPDDPSGAIVRAPVDDPQGVFSVVVPAFDDADHVALVTSPLHAGSHEAAAEAARFTLDPPPGGPR